MNTRTLVLLIPLLVCVGFIPVVGIFGVILIILYYVLKEVSAGNSYESFDDITATKINMDQYNTDVLDEMK